MAVLAGCLPLSLWRVAVASDSLGWAGVAPLPLIPAIYGLIGWGLPFGTPTIGSYRKRPSPRQEERLSVPRQPKYQTVTVGIDGIAFVWAKALDSGPSHDGEIAGDGSPVSQEIVRRAHALATDPVRVDHPQLRQPSWTTLNSPQGALVTLVVAGNWRAQVLEAPLDVVAEVFVLEHYDEDGDPIPGLEDIQ